MKLVFFEDQSKAGLSMNEYFLRLLVPLLRHGGLFNRRAILFVSTKASRQILDAHGAPISIGITDAAEQRLEKVVRDDRTFLRLAIDNGGCHGFQYKFSLDEKLHPDDVVFSKGKVRVVIDEVSLPYINGSQVDFADELIGSFFKIANNPMAGTDCGCGVSFDYKPLNKTSGVAIGWGMMTGLAALFLTERLPMFRRDVFSRIPVIGKRYHEYHRKDEDSDE